LAGISGAPVLLALNHEKRDLLGLRESRVGWTTAGAS
jgi:hypothetical protein